MTRKERWRDKFPAGGNEMEELQGENRAELHETGRNLATLGVSTPRELQLGEKSPSLVPQSSRLSHRLNGPISFGGKRLELDVFD